MLKSQIFDTGVLVVIKRVPSYEGYPESGQVTEQFKIVFIDYCFRKSIQEVAQIGKNRTQLWSGGTMRKQLLFFRRRIKSRLPKSCVWMSCLFKGYKHGSSVWSHLAPKLGGKAESLFKKEWISVHLLFLLSGIISTEKVY